MFSGIYHPLDANSRATKRIEDKNMNPRNLTREAIEQLNDIEPYCFETDREEQWFNVGLQYGLDVADSDPISPWISVEDDLPCNHSDLVLTYNGIPFSTKRVLVMTDIHTLFLCEMKKDDDHGWIWNYLTKDKITHWFPIPEL